MNRSIQMGYVHINFAAKFDANFIYRPADIHFAQIESLYIIGFCLTDALRLAFLYAYVSFITGKSLLIKKALCIIMHYSFKHEAMPAVITADIDDYFYALLSPRRAFFRNEHAAHIRMLQLQQPDFFVKAARISRQAPVCAHHTVTRNNDGNFIVPHRPADRLRRHFLKPHVLRNLLCNISVCSSGTVRYLQKKLPHGTAKF